MYNVKHFVRFAIATLSFFFFTQLQLEILLNYVSTRMRGVTHSITETRNSAITFF